ncbi:RHS repeat protein, partial [Pleionea sp. CnH1-48]|uniref:RHS repeat protein n=1 Tax=Pleionea sp. CnH1-48 TaxID=2954494 RepID=UPI0020969EEC|nr:RHS repeat protein [Pleionea sp. CnH1-48]
MTEYETVIPKNGPPMTVETHTRHTTETAYDAFGNAVAHKDARGNFSYKAYDALNRETYAINAEGYVTQYDYDAYGNQTLVTRYAGALQNFATNGLNQLHSEVSTKTALSGIESQGKRQVVNVYDVGNRVIEVQQTAVETFDVEVGKTHSQSPATVYEYNAYGDIIKTSQLVRYVSAANNNGTEVKEWAESYTYYDTLGRKTYEVNPERYLTHYDYNAFNEVERTTEYAVA